MIRLLSAGVGLIAELGGSVEQVVSCAVGVCCFFDLGELEVPFNQWFELEWEGGGDEVWSGVFVEWCFGGAGFADGVVSWEFESDIVVAVEGEPGFYGCCSDLLVVDPDACACWGGCDFDSSFDAAGECEECC